MSEQNEDRLRQHLSAVDRVQLPNASSVTASVERAGRRLRRRRRMAVGTVGVAMLVVGTVAVWQDRSQPHRLTTVAGSEVSSAPSDIGPAGGAEGTVTTEALATAEVPTTAQVPTSTELPTTITEMEVTTTGPAPSTTVPPPSAWSAIAPDPRGEVFYPSVVWTGTEAIAVGGTHVDGEQTPVAGAAAYDPATDTWRRLADDPSNSARINPLVFWTGAAMLVIGGDQPDGSLLKSYSEAYDPATDAWSIVEAPPIGIVSDRSPWVWTGTELYVWPTDAGGVPASTVTPLAYDPVANVWRTLPEPSIAPRERAASVWTGTEWIVWGGTTGTAELDDGAAFDPATGTWHALAPSPLFARRAAGVWTGTEMIVDAGSSGGDRVTGNGEMAFGDGAAYDPASDTWRPISPGLAHPGFVPLWTGSQLLMFAKGSGVVYDVATDQWVDTCCNDTGGGIGGTPVWTGSLVLLIGSTDPQAGGSIFTPPAVPPVSG